MHELLINYQVEQEYFNSIKEISLIKKKINPLFIGIGTLIMTVYTIFQQMTGITWLLCYITQILYLNLSHDNQAVQYAQNETAIIGIVNFIFSVISYFIIDKRPRIYYLMTGSTIMSFMLFLDGMIVEKALSKYSPMIWRNSLFYQIVWW